MGIQIHANENYRRVVELVQAGVVGPVSEVHVWVSRAWGLQSPEAAARNKDVVTVSERPKEGQPVPAGLDWDLWLGPAPERPLRSGMGPGPKGARGGGLGNGPQGRPGTPRERPAVRAPKAEGPAEGGGGRPAAAPGDRPRLDERDLRVRPPRRPAAGQ